MVVHEVRPPHLETMTTRYNCNHGTPGWILNIVRDEFGPITIDLASSRHHNVRVQAEHFFSEDDPCPYELDLVTTYPLNDPRAPVFNNPPGPAYSVQWFFDVWLGCINQGAQGGFLFFNMDQMRRCEPFTYRELVVLAFRDRVKYIGNRGGASFPSALVLTGPLKNEYSDIANVFEWIT